MVGRHRQDTIGGWRQLGLRAAGALLLAVSAGIHLDLYLAGYRFIPMIRWMVLLQVIVGFALAVAVLAICGRLVAAAGAGFALATLGGYLLSVWAGLFGFKEVRTTPGVAAGLIEVTAFATVPLAEVVAGLVQRADGPVSPAARMLARTQASAPVMIAAVGRISVLATVLSGVVVADADGPPVAAGAGHVLGLAERLAALRPSALTDR